MARDMAEKRAADGHLHLQVQARGRQLQEEATRRWLVKGELLFLLEHAEALAIPRRATACGRPGSGTLVLFDQREVGDFKKDGWQWQKRKDGSGRVREDRAKLVLSRSVVILGTYVHSEEKRTFHRRSYHVRDSNPWLVLVHYFDEGCKGGEAVESALSVAMAPQQVVQAPEYPVPMDEDGGKAEAEEGVPLWLETSETSDNGNASSIDSIMKDCLDMDSIQVPSNHFHDEVPHEYAPNQDVVMMNDTISPFDGGMLFPELACVLPPSSGIVASPVSISDFSPDWDFVNGGAKILICLASTLSSTNAVDASTPVYVMFGLSKCVPAERVSDTVLRCTAPRATREGTVDFFVCSSAQTTSENWLQLSTKRCFHYKKRALPPLSTIAIDQDENIKQGGAVAGKRGRSPHPSQCASPWSSFFSSLSSNPEAGHLAAFVDAGLDERQCKIRVVERLSEVHKAIRTTARQDNVLSPRGLGEYLKADDALQYNDDEHSVASSTDIFRQLMFRDDDSRSMDDGMFETLSDQELAMLSEQLLDRVVHQLVTLAHTNEELLEELNSLDEGGLSLLHYMSFYNCAHLIPVLLAHGARINQQSTNGQTALHLAAGCGHQEVVDCLLSAGADLWIIDSHGLTPAERAVKSGHRAVASHLQALVEKPITEDSSCDVDDNVALSLSTNSMPPIISVNCSHTVSDSDEDARLTEIIKETKPALFVGENEEHNRKFLLGALSTMSLHDRCALSLGISRDFSPDTLRRRGSSADEDISTASSSQSTSNPFSVDIGTAGSSIPNEVESMCDSEVKSVLADDEQQMQRLEAAMELMGPEELQSLEDEARVIQHNFRAWLLRRNCRKMHEATTRLHEAAKSIEDEMKKQEETEKDGSLGHSTMSEQEMVQRERAAVTMQAAARTMLARKSFLQTRNVTIKVQAATRGVLCRRNFARMKSHALASLVIQRNVREWLSKHPSTTSSTHREDEDSAEACTASSPLVIQNGNENRDSSEEDDEGKIEATDLASLMPSP